MTDYLWGDAERPEGLALGEGQGRKEKDEEVLGHESHVGCFGAFWKSGLGKILFEKSDNLLIHCDNFLRIKSY